MHPLQVTAGLSRSDYAAFREAAIFDCCKWDPQVEDVSVLAPFAFSLTPETWSELATLAEDLAAETIAAEAELAQRTDLHARLGFSRRLRKALALAAKQPAAEAARCMRFDFHWTDAGWQISEVNSDVPGGFNEASGVARLMSQFVGGELPGDPAQSLALAVAGRITHRGPVGLVHATAYADDRQVMAYLGHELARLAVEAVPLNPADLLWRDRQAHTPDGRALAAIVRFYPAEWLPELPRRAQWTELFTARTPAANTPRALLTQSKRWPLVWDELDTQLPTWLRLLPETRDPREVDWRRDERWLVKPALGRIGDGVGLREVVTPDEWRRIARSAAWFPRAWVAQQRFEVMPNRTPQGLRFAALGVYVIDGRVAGIYARCSPTPLIDQRASEVAVLIDAAVPVQPEVLCHVGT
jgi:glutathionylspermidine synthase